MIQRNKKVRTFAAFLRAIDSFTELKKQKKKMKKVAFMFVAAMAISFASCGGQTKAADEACDSTCCADSVEAVVEEVVDSAAAVADSVVAEVAEVVAE